MGILLKGQTSNKELVLKELRNLLSNDYLNILLIIEGDLFLLSSNEQRGEGDYMILLVNLKNLKTIFSDTSFDVTADTIEKMDSNFIDFLEDFENIEIVKRDIEITL